MLNVSLAKWRLVEAAQLARVQRVELAAQQVEGGDAAFHIHRHGARQVDVNKQNPQATAFYLGQGFQQVGRSALDGADRPFPLLHLHLG
jgi:hypothetical protein